MARPDDLLHAVAILGDNEFWEWGPAQHFTEPGEFGGKYKTVAGKLLSGFLSESYTLGGTLVDKFWSTIEQCDVRLQRNGVSVTPCFPSRHYRGLTLP